MLNEIGYDGIVPFEIIPNPNIEQNDLSSRVHKLIRLEGSRDELLNLLNLLFTTSLPVSSPSTQQH